MPSEKKKIFISQHIKLVDYSKLAIPLHFEIWTSINSKDTCLLACFLPAHSSVSCTVGPFSLQNSICPFIQVFDLPSVRLLDERRLFVLLFTERTLSRDTAANTGDISKACWCLFQSVLSHPNSTLQRW